MNPGTANEARLLFWPWVFNNFRRTVASDKTLPVGQRADWPEAISVFGFFGGAAVLTAISFRQALRLNQQVSAEQNEDRGKIWREKMIVLAIAIAVAGLIACAVQTARRPSMLLKT